MLAFTRRTLLWKYAAYCAGLVSVLLAISGMVGGAGLGFQAVEGLARSAVGQGIEAGLAIVILAIILDRITHAWATRQN